MGAFDLEKINEKSVNHEIIEGIINGMYDWVRVIDRNDRIIYTNKAMADGLKNNPVGMRCFEAIGKDSPCPNCVLRKAVFDGVPHVKEEIIGDRIFSVMSSPIKENGEIIAVVEVLRDVTSMKQLQHSLVLQNKKLQDDLNLAKKLQCSLLPKHLPEDKINFSFVYKPCEALGGDFLDIFNIDGDHIGIYIADVSGHGVSASMLTVFLRSSIDKKTLSPSLALNKLYEEFNKNNFDQDLYITLFYAIINLKDYTLTYTNAGHSVCPFVFNKNRFEILRTPGTPISNWIDAPEYTEGKLQLLHGDRLFFYTDGIIELKNEKKEQFGEERLLDILLDNTSEPAVILNTIIDRAVGFAQGPAYEGIPDDITIALIEIK